MIESAQMTRERGIARRMLAIVERQRRRDEVRDLKRRMADAAMLGLIVPSRINKAKWWWKVDHIDLITRAHFGSSHAHRHGRSGGG